MKTLKLQMQTSIDGTIAGPESARLFNWDEEVRNYSIANTEKVESILLGRKTAKDFIPHWNAVAANRDDADFEFRRIIAQIPKIVFSKSLKISEWENATITQGEIVEQINQLKKEANEDILVYGGISFVSSLIEHDLIDEYHLLVNPVAVGRGPTVFSSLKKPMRLTFVKTRQFKCGTVLLCYESQRK